MLYGVECAHLILQPLVTIEVLMLACLLRGQDTAAVLDSSALLHLDLHLQGNNMKQINNSEC